MKLLAALWGVFFHKKEENTPTFIPVPKEPLSLERTKISEESIRAIADEYGYSFELWTKPDGCIYRFIKLYETEEKKKIAQIEEEMEVW